MKHLLNPTRHMAYDMLYSLLDASAKGGDADHANLVAAMNAGNAQIIDLQFYLRKQLTSTTLNPFRDISTSVTAGVTNFEKGKFPFKFVGVFTHFYLGHCLGASDGSAVQTLRYNNNIYDPTVEQGGAITDASPSLTFGVKTDYLKVGAAILNSEISLRLGTKEIFTRVPMNKFFRHGNYDAECLVRSGYNFDNAYPIAQPIITNSDNTPDLEIVLADSQSIPSYTYLDYAFLGLGIRISK